MKFAPQFEKYRDKKLNILEVDLPSIELSRPPEDTSHVTRMELDEIEEHTSEAKLPKALIAVADKDPIKLFTATAKKHKLDPLEDKAELVSQDWNTIAFYFKDRFKRRRPYEVQKEYDLSFPVNRTSSSESPSYPSGHALMGYGLAEFYKEQYPYLNEEWDNIADVIAHSRIQMGVHYPSDIKASKRIISQVKEQQKTASERLRTTIFGVDPAGKLLHGFGGQGFYKFPGGGVDAGESIIDAAKRELLEEAGYDVDSIEELPGLDTTDAVASGSAKGHMGHGSSRTKYLLARLGKRNESLLGSEGDAIANLQTAPIEEVLQGLEGDMLFGSGVAESNYQALNRVKELLSKTAEEQPLLRHRSTLLIRDPETGKLLAAKSPKESKASPFFFPGGGLYDDEYDTPRNPSDEDILEGARREALEELGIELDNPRIVGSFGKELEGWWREKTLKNRGVPYVGGHEHYVLADKGKEDRSMYNVEGDAFEQGDYYDPKEIVKALTRAANSDSEFAPFNKVQVKAIKDNLLKKNASDLSVLTTVPTQNLDLIMRKGLYSQKAMLDDPEVLSAFLAQRNADKAWKDDEQYDEKRFKEQYDKRLKLMEGDDAALSGPSVFFTEPDPDKVSDPRHFINKFDTQKLRVNLAKLLRDIPETRIQGAELIPFPANAMSMSDEEWDEIAKQRRRDLTSDEVEAYTATDPKELWKDYGEDHIGRYYAANVPHAFIRTPSGIIPPEYLEQVEKTSEAKRLYHGSPLDLEELELRVPPHHTGKGEAGEAGVYAADNPIAAALYALARNKSRGSWGVTKDNRLVMKDYKKLNPEGYVYELDSKDYTAPPEDHPALGYAVKDPNIKSKRKVTEADIADYIDRVASKEEFMRALNLSKQASLEAEFLPDFTPEDLAEMGVFDQVYGDAPSEASMKEWPEHWINKQDPLGWLQWYDRYSKGRRTEDDARQIKRWKSFKARHLAQYLKNPTLKRKAALRNWAIDVEK